MAAAFSYDSVLEVREQLQQVVSHFQKVIAKLRSGRAHPGLIEEVMINSYGSQHPLKQLAMITTGEATQLIVTPYDPTVASAIDHALRFADLGLKTVPMGSTIRVCLPPLTEERRKELVKLLKRELEQANISARSVRRTMNDQLDRAKQEKQISQDEHWQAVHRLEEQCEACYAELRNVFKAKEAEVLKL